MKTKFSVLAFWLVVFGQVVFAQSAFRVEVKGQGAPVLLFPGFGCTGQVWDETVAELAKTHECHVFTLAGFGGVPAIARPWLATIKTEVVAYVKAKKLAKPTLLGHSLGGTLSLWLAASEPTLFGQVVAVDALPCSAALMIPNYNGEPIPADNPQSAMMLKLDSAAFVAMNAQSVPFMCRNVAKQSAIVGWMAQADRQTYVYGYIELLNLDLREQIANIRVPVTILAATNPDLATVQKTYQAQYAKLPSVVVHYAEKSAHFVMFDQPEWFLAKLKQLIP
jgi:pimeloyl-ACP methyl ester carboxylesterase